MTCALRSGQRTWSCTRDSEGHRTYKIKFLVEHAITDGPANVLQCPGLPAVGSTWNFDSDVDVWAWCRPDATVTPLLEKEQNTLSEIELTFSTKFTWPDSQRQRCQTIQIQNPLSEPAKVNGKGVKYTEERNYDKDGKPILNSAKELVRGAQVQFDANRDTLTIEQNVATFASVTAAYAMRDTVNQFTIWGSSPRTVKLSQVNFERLYQGICSTYFKRTLEFDFNNNPYNGFDRYVLDEGQMAMRGKWVEGRDKKNYVPGGQDAQFTITVGAGGAITGATLVSPTTGGSGYPRNSIIGLLAKTGGVNGVIRAYVDSNGAVSDVRDIWNGGTGYSAGTTTTTFGLSWVLELVDGWPPDFYKNKPSVITSRYKDRKGDYAKAQLDGKGYPLGAYYRDVNTGDPLGQPAIGGRIFVQEYLESDFTTLGVPLSFDNT